MVSRRLLPPTTEDRTSQLGPMMGFTIKERSTRLNLLPDRIARLTQSGREAGNDGSGHVIPKESGSEGEKIKPRADFEAHFQKQQTELVNHVDR